MGSPATRPDFEGLVRPTLRPPENSEAMHVSFHHDKDLTDLEFKSLFFDGWCAVAHISELAKFGDVKVVDLGDKSFILTRAKKGGIRAFHNVCRHKGVRLCAKSATNCRQLVCPYHRWAYRLDGSLKSTPPHARPHDRKEALALIPVAHIETFAGFVFLNQRADAAPLSESLGNLPKKFERYDLDIAA